MDCKKIGEFIKKLREENGLSQNALASKLFVTRQAISRWESGANLPDVENLKMLSDIFGVSHDELFRGERQKSDDINYEDINLEIYDTSVRFHNKYKKSKIISIFFAILIVILIIIFLLYYFFNNYGSVNVYSLYGEDIKNDVILNNGVVLLTNETTYFRAGTLYGINNDEVQFYKVYYKDSNGERLIYKTDSYEDPLIFENNTYNDYFYKKINDDFLNFLYMDIISDKQTITIKINAKKRYSNKKIFTYKAQKISNFEKSSTNQDAENKNKVNSSNLNLFNKIEKTFRKNSETDMLSSYSLRYDSVDYEMLYDYYLNNLNIYPKQNRNNENYFYSLKNSKMLYSINSYMCEYQENVSVYNTKEKRVICSSDIVDNFKKMVSQIK